MSFFISLRTLLEWKLYHKGTLCWSSWRNKRRTILVF